MLHEWVNWPRHFWRRLRRLPPSNDAWDDERWTAILTVIIQQRKKTYLPTAAIRIGTFCAEVKELPDSKGYKVVDQVKTRFQDRDWQNCIVIKYGSTACRYQSQTQSMH